MYSFIKIEKLGGKTIFEWGSDISHFRYAELKAPKSGVQDGCERTEMETQ